MSRHRRKKSIFKFLFKFAAIIVVLFCSGFFLNYFAVTSQTNLSQEKLTKALSSPTVKIMASDNSEVNITPTASMNISIDKIPKTTINAFITSEDRSFYAHKGIDYKRIAGAIIQNLKSGKFKQGGSTISQQLIKNTHLSSEKTINRKLKEIKLTKQLEEKYSKDKILELYLNTIYFGNGCYGINEASNFYFGKPASSLSVAQSAILAGIISSPTYNEPAGHFDKATKKKEQILSNMQKLGYITDQEYKTALDEEIKIQKLNKNSTCQFIESVIHEATQILGLTENQIRNKELTIFTRLDSALDSFILNLVNNPSFSPANENGIVPIVQSIVIDNHTKNVIAYSSNQPNNIENMKRQPGSAIKPLLVYAPAFEYNKMTPSSFVLDEKTSFGEYTPKNSNDNYLGWTNIRTAISKSLNVPAVKTLSYVGTEKAIEFAQKLGLKFDEKDNHLAIALGGMTYGTTLKEIADAYSSFACDGKYQKSGFITKIVDHKNRTIYEQKINPKQVMSEETSYMITSSLLTTVRDGTAKKLHIDGIEIASKTGTTNDQKEAWNICYTTDHTIATFIGNNDHSKLPNIINGSTHPTLINREIIKKLTEQNKPEKFYIPDGIISANIENESKNNQKLLLSPDQKNKSDMQEIFTKQTLPQIKTDTEILLKLNVINHEKNQPIIKIYSKNAENVVIFKEINNKTAIFKEIKGPENNIEITDTSVKSGELITYYAEAKNNSKTVISKKIKIKIF